jgi:transcriptional regulator with XRE-family HTH domain
MEQKKLIISGKKFSDAVDASKIKQDEIGEKIGVTRQWVSNWKQWREIEVTPDQAARMCKVLKVSLEELIQDETPPEKPTIKEKPILSMYEDAGDLYQRFYEQHTTEDYVLVPRVIIETYEITPKSEQESKRKLVDAALAALADQKDHIETLKKNVEELRKSLDLGRSLRKQNV